MPVFSAQCNLRQHTLEKKSTCPALICNMVYDVWDITALLETKCTWAAVICNMAYEVCDMSAALEKKSTSPAVICNWAVQNARWNAFDGLLRQPQESGLL